MDSFFSDYKGEPEDNADNLSAQVDEEQSVVTPEADDEEITSANEEHTSGRSSHNHKNAEPDGFSAEIFEWLDVLVTAIVAVVIIFSILFRVATIEGPSMKETLHDADKVIISNLFYTPVKGDIVVISRNTYNNPEDYSDSNLPIIKRVIATAGDTVDIDFTSGIVSVNGVELDEPYTRTPTNRKYDIEFPVAVPEGYIFVLGDNRNESLDSRSSMIGEKGMIDTRYVLGHASFRIMPFSQFGSLK